MVAKMDGAYPRRNRRHRQGQGDCAFTMSATEQHGAHLPVGTDAVILQTLIERFCASEAFEGHSVLFAPQLFVGKSNEHMGFAGTLTFSAQTYYSLLFDLAKSIGAHGFKKLVLMNSHGGNTDMANLISRDIRIELGLEVFVFDWWFTDFLAGGSQGLRESGKVRGVPRLASWKPR